MRHGEDYTPGAPGLGRDSGLSAASAGQAGLAGLRVYDTQHATPTALTRGRAAARRHPGQSLRPDHRAAAQSTRPPNIVIIFADDLGYGDLGVYGHPLIRTPRLDRLAAEGLKLTSFYASAPVCSASRYSLLTGRYAIRAGINGALMPESTNGLGADETTIADILKSAGYRTGMVGKWHLGNRPGFFPTEHGFDSYFGLLYSNDMVRPWVQTDVPLRLYRGTQGTPGRGRQRNPHRALHRGGRRLHRGEQEPAVLPLPGPLDAPRAARRVAEVRGPVGERPLRRCRRGHRLEHRPGARRAAGRGRRARHARHLHQRQRAVDGHAAPDARRSADRPHRRGQRGASARQQGHHLGGRRPGSVPGALARAHSGRSGRHGPGDDHGHPAHARRHRRRAAARGTGD